MEIRTVLLIILAVIAALTIVFYQYFFKSRHKGSLRIVLASLRFVVLFGAFLLLINPKFIDEDYFLEKSNLILLLDDSASMTKSSNAEDIKRAVANFQNNEALKERFSLFQFKFGSDIEEGDSLSFQQQNTNIANALSKTNELFINGNNTIVLLSDGNQTLGRDYEFLNLKENVQVNPVVIGDTTDYADIAIGQINTNTYAFLGNKFPVEATIEYTGEESVAKNLVITMDGRRVFQETVRFDPAENSKRVNTVIEAESVGLKTLEFKVSELANEKNRINNSKVAALEVIDEKTNVTLVSDILHPDIGALKKSIESNEQRQLNIVNTRATEDILENSDVFILYQPNGNFKRTYDFIEANNVNYFTITGTQTDWGFLNQVQESFFKEDFNQKEEIQPVLNRSFSVFGIGEFNTADYPPLMANLGDLEISTDYETILNQRIKGVNLEVPLLTIFPKASQKEVVLFGENVWRWRAKSYLENNNFNVFDDFIGKLIFFLNSDGKRSRLELDYKRVFEGAEAARIKASYFDKSFVLDPNGNVQIEITGKDFEYGRQAPMLFNGSYFEYDLGNLNSGTYEFTVRELREGISKSGTFKIVEFKQEDQLFSANYEKLNRLSEKTGGKVYLPNELEDLTEDLLNSDLTLPIQRSKQNVVSLIDFRILLGLIVLCLALEWFIRKYNGLI
ncbi:vWA domain-containing protein [Flagellimonas sp.]|uniref:vWA domain-containing protein n=1 Tax=Flagellimonas sp. TaxID=2058762 RepID=UPI003F49DF07